MTMTKEDWYTNKYIKKIREAKKSAELNLIINMIYEDGFFDGFNEAKK